MVLCPQMGVQQELTDHLLRDYTEPIRDPLWGHMYIWGPLLSLMDTPEGQQLGRIRQLGPTAMVYPGATHTRLSHSFGVFHIARRILLRLLHHPQCPALTLEGVRAFLAAALLHDVGHFPYTHSFKSLPLMEHETLTGRLVQTGGLATRLRERVQVEPGIVAAIVDEQLPDCGSDEIRLYRRILSGTMDPDKLDYLNRDAYFCGVPYGVQDLDYALNQIIPNGYNGIALEESGVSAVENILFSKYLMYRAVYWHRTVRVATAMVKKAVFLGLRDGAIQPEDLYGLDDQLFFSRVGGIAYEPFQLIRGVAERALLKPVATIPFDPSRSAHQALQRQEFRSTLEEQISGDLGVAPWEVILDLPDAISFEADIPIIGPDGPCPFVTRSVFSPDVVSRFTGQLRKIRLIVPQRVIRLLTDPHQYLLNLLAAQVSPGETP